MYENCEKLDDVKGKPFAMSIQYKNELIVTGCILILYIGASLASHAGYVQQLTDVAALALGLALAFVGGIIVGATIVYVWTCMKKQRGAASSSEEHAT
jgi:hypothetical protein